MGRRKEYPEKAALRRMMNDYLKDNNISIKDGADIHSIVKNMMSVILKGVLKNLTKNLVI